MTISKREQWRTIPGIPNYLISNFGRAYSLKTNKFLKPDDKSNEYLMYAFWVDGKRVSELAHRVVYRSFVGEISKNLEINHKDENKHNNRLENLEIVTRRENILYNNGLQRRFETRRKNMAEQGKTWNGAEKPCMNIDTGNVYFSATEAAIQTGGKRTSISNACAGARKTYRKERWIYINKEDYYARNHGME